jgi:hypothetical protein
MAQNLYGSLSLKQDGGLPVTPYQKPIIYAGQYCKLAVIITDFSDRALTLTPYSLKLRLKKTDGTILVLQGTPFDNPKGEMEFELVPDDSKLLKVGSNLDAELELYLTGSPQVTSFITIKEAISIVNQTLPPAP